jgi:hypothetical protein
VKKDEAKLKVVEYYRVGNTWRPHSIVTDQATWDASWSKSYGGLLVHESGSGLYEGRAYAINKLLPTTPPARIWVADDVKLVHVVYRKRVLPYRHEDSKENPIKTDAALRRLGWVRVKKLPGDPFDGADFTEGGIAYCRICDDHLNDEHPCDHLVWSDVATQLVGVGTVDSSLEATMAQSYEALFTRLGAEGVRKLRAALSLHLGWFHDPIWETLRELRNEYDDCEVAANYLRTITAEVKVKSALRETVRRVDGWLKREAA